jgi:GNAT superfamily N-acetyltransferase
MKIVVSLELNPVRKREIQERLTALIPEWFGLPDANLHYGNQAEVLRGYVASIGEEPKGLLLLKTHSPISAEVYWVGVDPAYHRSGIGRALIEAASDTARRDGAKFLFVATLHPSVNYEPYQRTRRFYEALGFQYVLEEQFPDEQNPQGYYMKALT